MQYLLFPVTVLYEKKITEILIVYEKVPTQKQIGEILKFSIRKPQNFGFFDLPKYLVYLLLILTIIFVTYFHRNTFK